MASQESLSGNFVEAAEAEREVLAVRLAEANERAEHFEALVSEARGEASSLVS